MLRNRSSKSLVTLLFIIVAILAIQPVAAQGVTGTFYWVQNTAWHPVHQLTQLSFMVGCEAAGVQCALATTDETSLESLIAIAEQTVDRPDNAGMAVWCCGLPQLRPAVEAAAAKGIPVVMLHGPVPRGEFPDNMVVIAADTTKYPIPVARAFCEALGGQTGTVAITQNNFNPTEDAVAAAFTQGMATYCPDVTVLAPQLEGPEPTQAIAAAVAIMQANPDLIGGFSTTGGGPTTWAGAQRETGKSIIAVGMDYTRVNLDLVAAGQIYGIVAQPLYTESREAAIVLSRLANGETDKVPYWTELDAPLVTIDDLAPYYAMLDGFEPQMRPTPSS